MGSRRTTDANGSEGDLERRETGEMRLVARCREQVPRHQAVGEARQFERQCTHSSSPHTPLSFLGRCCNMAVEVTCNCHRYRWQLQSRGARAVTASRARGGRGVVFDERDGELELELEVVARRGYQAALPLAVHTV
eukprot:gene32285-biopygen5908